MARAQVPFFALNAGEVGRTALARVDLEKMRLAAEEMVNWVPTVLGPISIRPGLKYLGSTVSDAKCRLLPFIFNASTTSLIEVTAGGMRVRNADTLVTYVNHSSVIAGGTFAGVSGTYSRTSPSTTLTITSAAHGLTSGNSIYADFTSGTGLDGFYTITVTGVDTFTITTVASTTTSGNVTFYPGWTNQSTTGASVSMASGRLVLSSTEYSYARARQAVTVAGGDQAKLHCVKIVVARGPVIFRVGTTAGGAELIGNQTLDEGTHHISFVPGAATVHLEVEAINEGRAQRLVDSIDFFKNADLLIPVPWAEADLNNIRYAQSGSVLFLACDGYPQYKIERRGANSWGLSRYYTTAGPYLGYSPRKEKLKPSAINGDVTITADQPYFTAGMVGSTFEITHPRQQPDIVFTGEDQYSDWIRVTGINTSDRRFFVNITLGAGASGTITLERAYGVPEGWTSYKTYTNNQSSTSIDDSQVVTGPPAEASSNNLIVYYRLAARPGATIVGTITASLVYQGGNRTGIFRLTGYTSPTSASAEVIRQLGDTNYTDDWREGAWSDTASWPSSVAFHDGRIWWAGLDKLYGSVSDDFYNYDPATEGDAGPIVRSVATGPVEGIGWMLPLQRLVVGTASAEVSIRSSSFDEPLTPTAFTARNASTVGSSPVQAIAVDSTGIFVQRNKSKIFELVYDVEINDYASREVTRLNQDICKPGVTQLAVQRQPDTRVFFIKEDGTLAMLVYDRADAVSGLCRMETDGEFESIAILPTGEEDDVYFVVKRTINSVTKRYIEKFASTSELQGGEESYLMDSSVKFVSGGGTTATITGLTHLIGKEVVVYYPRFGGYQSDAFQDDAFQVTDDEASEPRTTYTVNGSGEITLDFAVDEIIVGLPYQARFKSVKLAYGSTAGTALTQKKRVDHLALLGVNTAPDGLRIGRDFTNMTKLSSVFRGKILEPYYIVEDWDYDATSFGGKFDTDSRVCIEANSPYPATISGMVIHMQTHDRG
jgi:hypothetical protein